VYRTRRTVEQFWSVSGAVLALLVSVPGGVSVMAQQPPIVLQSTTSTANSGLYESLLPRFHERTGITVHVVAVGTGQALKNARNGDGDVLLVHARKAEQDFVAQGWGLERFDLMYNDFVLVGPEVDPAGIAGSSDIVEALRAIAGSGSSFISRGDDSGTHRKERALWQLAQVDVEKVSGSWYLEAGSGMGATLNVAIGKGAYTLTDRGTWLSFENRNHHKVLSQGDRRLFNQYGIILVNPARHPRVSAAQGQAFINWLLGPEGQQAIADYRLGGEQLFFPNAKAGQ
jgi:tungstate transport system substrate-binding protein